MTDQPTAAMQERVAASRRLAELINSYQISAAIGAFARLGVADALAEGPASPAEHAAQLGADERSLARLLEATLEVGLFEACDGGRYALTPLGQLLRSDVEGSLHRLALVSTDEWRWRGYGHLTHAVRTGEPGVVPDDPSPAPGVARLVKQTDLEMLAVVGGRERTAAEFRELLTQAAFSLARILPLEGMPWSLMEGVTV